MWRNRELLGFWCFALSALLAFLPSVVADAAATDLSVKQVKALLAAADGAPPDLSSKNLSGLDHQEEVDRERAPVH